MIDLAITVLDALPWLTLAAFVAFVAHQTLGVLRDANWLRDSTWPETPGARNDRARVMEDRVQ